MTKVVGCQDFSCAHNVERTFCARSFLGYRVAVEKLFSSGMNHLPAVNRIEKRFRLPRV
jgi:hypothetical protein